jgi:L-asparaginase
LIIYTGGTIGMKADATDQTLKPFDFSQILEEVPELAKFAFKIDSYTFDPLIDSSDVEPGLWQKLAAVIRDHYDRYDGFLVLHGTDTMSYSASALSFMLDGLSKPVIFTGSQLPIGIPRTDGKENLISAVEIASARRPDGTAVVPEVCIYFGSKLLRGNRTTKISAEQFDAFASPNLPALAEAGINIRYNRALIRRPRPEVTFRIDTRLDTRVSILKIHPGITPEVVTVFLLAPEIRAVILETYGSGNAITRPWFLSLVRTASQSKVVVNVTQCKSGTVNMDLYATGKTLKIAGVVSGYDITTEAALGKLFVLQGMSEDPEWVKNRFGEDLFGEISK